MAQQKLQNSPVFEFSEDTKDIRDRQLYRVNRKYHSIMDGMVVPQGELDERIAIQRGHFIEYFEKVAAYYQHLKSIGESDPRVSAFPIVIGILNGAREFTESLLDPREINFPVEHELTKVTSYSGMESGQIHQKQLDLPDGLVRGRPVLITEDVVDTGQTMDFVINDLTHRLGAARVDIMAMSAKPDKNVSYQHVNKYLMSVGFLIHPEVWLFGKGLDLDNRFRYLPFLGSLNKKATDRVKRMAREDMFEDMPTRFKEEDFVPPTKHKELESRLHC